jgi:hypothetical protein
MHNNRVAAHLFPGVLLTLFLATTSSGYAATLSVSPVEQTVQAGETFTVSILIDTEGVYIDGVDVNTLYFDPNFLRIRDVDPDTPGIQIDVRALMASTIVNEVDPKTGQIWFSQIADVDARYANSEPVELATITFEARRNGNAEVSFNYTPESTIDTNIAALGDDVLSEVKNGSYAISGNAPFVTRIVWWFKDLLGVY